MGERQALLAWAYLAVVGTAFAWGSLEEAYYRELSQTTLPENDDRLTLEETASAAGTGAFLGNLVAVTLREQMAAHLAA